MNRRTLAAAACLVLAAAGCNKNRPGPTDPTFRVSAKAKMTMEAKGEQQALDADAAFEYTWKPDGKVQTLFVNSAEVRAAAGGREVMNAKMSRDGFSDSKSGKSIDVKSPDAPEPLKKMLTDSFGSPICKIERDDAGREVKRTVVAGRGASTLIDSGMVANCTMFHPYFPPDKDEWEADLEVSSGNGLATGKVKYTKVPGGKGGQAVKVAGTLTADGVKGQGGLTVKDGKYVVAGEQTYDPAQKQWVAGKLTMDLDFKVSDGTSVVGSAKGELLVTFEMLNPKK